MNIPEFAYRDASPAREDLSDLIFADTLSEKRVGIAALVSEGFDARLDLRQHFVL